MAHLSLYRRFRPDTFDKMVRQEHVVTVLKNQIMNDAVGHAYLFCGPRGTGKTSVARIFARAVNCEHPKDGSPCGTCPACLALKDGNLDVTEIDAASNNGVNEMRDLRENVVYPPVTGRYKVYIVDEVHMLTDSAFNALLKTLEEPPRHVIFILATTEPQKIPATILSRCMRLDFKLIPDADLEAHLTRILEEIGTPYEKEAVAAIARAGAGSDRDILSIAETCLAYADKLTYESVTAVLGSADFNLTADLVASLLRADMPAALSATEQILAEGKSVGVLCRDILQLLNRVSIAKTCANAEKLLTLPERMFRRIADTARESDEHALLRATEIFAKAESELRFASSPRICLETAIVKTALPATDYDIEALLVRISALEKKIEELEKTGIGVGTVRVVEPIAPAAPAPAPPSMAAQADDYEFPGEEPIFEEGYFSDGGWEPETDPLPKAPAQPAKQEAKEPSKREENPKVSSQPAAVASAERPQTAEIAFGTFLRTLRKNFKNGVLFTMCADLEAVYEGDVLALYTESETIYRSLGRDNHRLVMQEALAMIGITQFEVRLKGKAETAADAAEQLKRDFSRYPIEIKE